MTRVLILTHEFAPFRGGIGALAHGLAAGAVECGFEPTVFAPDYGATHHAEDRVRGYRVVRFAGATCSMLSVDGLSRFAARIRRMIVRERPDRVHAADPQSHMALTALARIGLASFHSCTVHGTELLRYRSEWLLRWWMRGRLPRMRRAAAVSHTVADLALRNGFVDRSRLVIAHPAIADAWQATPPTPRTATRTAWRAGANDIVLFTLARRVPSKGHEDVLIALGTLHAELRGRAVCVVAGAGPDEYAGRLEARAREAGVRLVLLGEVTDQEAIAACDAADVFVMLSRETPSRLEGFGIAYLEAGARGLPALARATGGVAEAVRDGGTGLLLPADADASTTARALQRMIEDAQLRRRLGEAARGFAASFSWSRHAQIVFGEPGQRNGP